MEEKAPKEKASSVDVKAKDDAVMHDFKASSSSLVNMKFIVLLLIVALLGVGTGYLLAPKDGSGIASKVGIGSSVKKGETFGDGDLKVFKDTAEGKLAVGGIDGEGQYHLVRPGGDDQNVYLTSSLVDMSQFKGKKIKVWGETHQAQKAGWLMDVGRVEVLE